MIDLSTNYMGLRLRNPLVVASSSLTSTVEGVKRAKDAGAGAVVLKSIFEEQIEVEVDDLTQNTWLPGHPEALDYVRQMGFALGPAKYLDLVGQVKNAVSIPVIASLNCISPRWWTDYAQKLEYAGADALELNIAVMVSDPGRSSEQIEDIYVKIIEEVKARIKIPVAVKIGPYFTSIARFAGELVRGGASALVLFNRFYRFDIDIDRLELSTGQVFSSPEEISQSLRWISLLAGRMNVDLAASTGIHDGADVVKQILAGAAVVQLSSTLYLNGIQKLSSILSELEAWMEKQGVRSVADMRGKLSQKESERPELYERLQYIKSIVGME